MSARVLALLLILASFEAPTARAAVWNLNPSGTGDFPTIQAAIDAAMPGDEIVLADGTYTGPGNRNLDFLGKAITLRSASADPTACIIDCEWAVDDGCEAVGFFFRNGETSSTVVEGVSVLRTSANTYGPCHPGTGAVIDGASPTLRNLRFLEAAGHWYGNSVLSVTHSSSPSLESVSIEDCFAGDGLVSVSDGSSVAMDNVSIQGPQCRVMVLSGASAATLTGCLIQASGAASSSCSIITVWGGSSFQASSTAFRQCQGTVLEASGSTLELDGCVVLDNRSTDRPPAIEASGSQVDLSRCTVAGNRAASSVPIILANGASTLTIDQSIIGANCTPGGLDVSASAGTASCTALDDTRVAGLVLSDIVTDDPGFCEPRTCADPPSTDGLYSLLLVAAARDVPGCGTLGALYDVCTISVSPMTFGRIKAMYR